MPRFSVAFGRRRSTADSLDNAGLTGSSFRVLERAEVISSKPFDGGARLTAMTHSLHKSTGSDVTVDDNIFADLKSNRGSGSSNTTKTTLTDNSSRHSNASTAPSSADTGPSDDWRNAQRKPPITDIPLPPIPKSSSTGFLRAAGRTFSFGGQKKHLPAPPTIDESPPPTPPVRGIQTPPNGRPRAPTSSTSTTVTPPRVDEDFDLDLGGDFGKMLLGNDKRASVATVKMDKLIGQGPAPRSLTGPRSLQPTPIQIDKTAKVEPALYSWNSQHSNDQLIASSSPSVSPALKANNAPLPPSRDPSPLLERQRPGTSPDVGPRRPLLVPRKSDQEEGEDEEARLLKDSLSTVTRFMKGTGPGPSANSPSVSRYRRDESGLGGDDDSLFDSSPMYSSSKLASRNPARQHSPSPGSHKVMTPAEFERYRKDKERQDREREIVMSGSKTDGAQDEDNYEDDEDDVEKAKQQAKQRRKQEAHMAVYRQQMMKVTGESGGAPSRPSLQMSFSTPNLPNVGPAAGTANTSENSDEDEEIPLAILAAHGFPSKARPPNRLSTMASNPNLRASQLPSFQRPMSVVGGDPPGPANSRLPAFARNLPKDPFVGAGIVRNPVRESFALGGGGPAPGQPGAPVPPGGLVGVIANEERNRALRRGSPHLDSPSSAPGTPAFDPVGGIPAHMMYQPQPTLPVLTPGDQAQIQMTQQMQQFMQMQMQFMSMIAGQNGNAPPPPLMTGAGHHLTSPSVGNLSVMGGGGGGLATPEMMRHSFIGGGGNDSTLDLAPPYGRPGDAQMRTMSMVQPSSASWIQPVQQPVGGSFAPSIRISGGVGVGGSYAPSIAPSERSNIGLPGRYRPVSHVPPPPPQQQTQQLQQPAIGLPGHLRKSSTMSTALHQPSISVTRTGGGASDDDDEEGWEAMKAKREKKKSMWRAKKSIGDDISAFIS